MPFKKYISFALVLAVVIFLPAFAEDSNVSIELAYPNGDRASLYGSQLIVNSQDGTISKTFTGTSSMIYFDLSLPKDKIYEITPIVNDMTLTNFILDMKNNSQEIVRITIPSSTGIQVSVFYDDGYTPISNANVIFSSHKGNLIREGLTNHEGKTLRFWISAPQLQDEYYDLKTEYNGLSYDFGNIKPTPGSTSQKIITPWPKEVDFVKIRTIDGDNQNQIDREKKFSARISGNGFDSSVVFNRGEAYFTGLTIGEFNLEIFETENKTNFWYNQTIIVDEKNHDMEVKVTNPKLKFSKLPIPDTKNFLTKDWRKQSLTGEQEFENYLTLKTSGDKEPVFTRSPLYAPADFSNSALYAKIYVDNPSNLSEFRFIITSNDFDSDMLFFEPSLNEITPKSWNEIFFNMSDGKKFGNLELEKINRIQIWIKDDGTPVDVIIDTFSLTLASKSNIQKVPSCNCVAFRIDDIQDFWLNNVQMGLIDSFDENNVPVTIGIIGNKIGEDVRLINHLKKNSADSRNIEIANHGWDHEDFTTFTPLLQEILLKNTNDRIFEIFNVTPDVFIPPYNKFDASTISAMEKTGITHFSSEIDFSHPPFPLSENKLNHFPETAFTGDLNQEGTRFVGLTHDETFEQIQQSLFKNGFAVVTLHPQEYSQFLYGQYQNKIDESQISELENLFEALSVNGIKIVPINKINSPQIPSWIKNNASWWAEDQIDDDTFIQGIQFLIENDILSVPSTTVDSDNMSDDIPSWIKNNASWWAEDQIDDDTFIQGIQFLIKKGILVIG